MAVRTIECIECGTTVPYGRLSCPSCGELLASVVGAARRLTSIVPTAPEPAGPIPSVLHEDDADAGDLGSLTWPTVSADPVTASEVDVIGEARSSASSGRAAPPFPPQPSITVAPPADTPGAYVPPAQVAPPAATSVVPLAGEVTAAGPPAPARSWAGSTNAEPGLSSSAGLDGPVARRGAELSLTDPARRAEAIDWIAVAGAALGSVGFLLPWARTIIGADGVGYLDSWGFAGPGHVLVVVGMLVVLALAVAETRIPAWVRLGIPGLVLSALLVGLLWPYILGPLGPLPGAYLSLAGALVLGGAAVAALAVDRHGRPDPSV